MELGRTENSEIIFIHTDDLEVTIKGGASGDPPPFVTPDQLESSVVIACASEFRPSVRGRAVVVGEETFAGRRTASVSCDPLFFEQKNYALIAEANEGHTLEFDHENVNLRKNITRFGRKDHVLSGTLNFRNDIGMSDLIFKLDGQEYLRITIEVYPSKISYKKDYQEIIADVTAEVYNLAFDAFRRTYDSFSLSGKTGNSPIEFFTIIRQIYKDFTIAADMIIARPHHVLQSDHVVLPQHKVCRADNATLRWIEKHPEHVVRKGIRNEQFFSIEALNREIRRKLQEYNNRPFAAKEDSRSELFRNEDLPLLTPLPATPYEPASWKKAKVQFNYHITLGFMHYSCPYDLIGKDVDVRVTDSAIEIFYKQNRVASHKRLHGRRGQYSTAQDHMPEKHKQYQEWDGDRFRQ